MHAGINFVQSMLDDILCETQFFKITKINTLPDSQEKALR